MHTPHLKTEPLPPNRYRPSSFYRLRVLPKFQELKRERCSSQRPASSSLTALSHHESKGKSLDFQRAWTASSRAMKTNCRWIQNGSKATVKKVWEWRDLDEMFSISRARMRGLSDADNVLVLLLVQALMGLFHSARRVEILHHLRSTHPTEYSCHPRRLAAQGSRFAPSTTHRALSRQPYGSCMDMGLSRPQLTTYSVSPRSSLMSFALPQKYIGMQIKASFLFYLCWLLFVPQCLRI